MTRAQEKASVNTAGLMYTAAENLPARFGGGKPRVRGVFFEMPHEGLAIRAWSVETVAAYIKKTVSKTNRLEKIFFADGERPPPMVGRIGTRAERRGTSWAMRRGNFDWDGVAEKMKWLKAATAKHYGTLARPFEPGENLADIVLGRAQRGVIASPGDAVSMRMRLRVRTIRDRR